MGNIMVRMGVVIGVLAAAQLGLIYIGHLNHPAIVEPKRPIEDFPMVVNTPATGTWEGKTAKLDERQFNESGVDSAVSRIYSREGRSLKFLLAEYRQPALGLYHNPMNCYHTQGFTQIGEVERQPLKARNRPDATISVTTWKRNSETVIVGYWYEVGDYTLYERDDLWPVQKAMFGKSKWPAMFKVLLEMPAGDNEQSKTEMLDMAQFVRGWLGEIQPVLD